MTVSFHYWIFDLDGTLADTAEDIIDSLTNACEAVLGFRPAFDACWIGPPLSEILKRIGPPLSAEQIAQIIHIFREKYSASGFPATHLYPGVSELLEHLQEHGNILYVATNKPLRLANEILAKENILTSFERIMTSDAMEEPLSKEQMVRLLLDVHGVPLEAAVLIGDTPMDIKAAWNNKIVSVAAGWGYGDSESLRAENPNFFCKTVQELREWMDATN